LFDQSLLCQILALERSVTKPLLDTHEPRGMKGI
jgi:hypothetical protein